MPGERGGGRRWGWHPLHPEWAARVVAQSPVQPGDLVLDLGAGTGALTAPLLAAGARVLAVELHPGRADTLAARCACPRLRVVRADLDRFRLPHQPYRVVASPPFALTSMLVRRLLASPELRSADLVVQGSAARRLARQGAGRSHQLRVGQPLPRRAFNPPPAVDSVILHIRLR
ncbi:MAG TPA: rRNA adenine N-6-methyltransferase family protein [Dermatophilaceae bacterium]|nr:rRNA adenine N-6-methyltransferase family protein [Dermatophilaceae bacterium]